MIWARAPRPYEFGAQRAVPLRSGFLRKRNDIGAARGRRRGLKNENIKLQSENAGFGGNH